MEFQGAIWRAGREVSGEGEERPSQDWSSAWPDHWEAPSGRVAQRMLNDFFLIVIF